MQTTTHERKSAWNDGGTFANQDLYWYAKGVGKMMSRPINDPTSWWFYAAIHGEYVDPSKPWYPGAGQLPSWDAILPPPTISTSPLPDGSVVGLYWDKCQHGSWYFLPWHRGYLLSIEAQLRKDIQSMHGPDNWSLPYWNYFGLDGQCHLPPALGQKTMQDEQSGQTVPNPLYVNMRYGPVGDPQNIYVPTSICSPRGTVNLDAMGNTLYTGSNSQTKTPGFGGPRTDFSHRGQRPHGNLEHNPHDLVHGNVGGRLATDPRYQGLMADPNTAALDPVFYLHHCNIDRLWAVWNLQNVNPTDASWLSGPTSERFVMPVTPGGELTAWYYTPAQMNTIAPLGYAYQEMTGLPDAQQLSQRVSSFALLGASAAQAAAAESNVSKPLISQELLGASATNLQVQGSGLRTAVNLRPEGAADVAARALAVKDSFSQLAAQSERAAPDDLAAPAPAAARAEAASVPTPDHFFLTLENITGTFDATIFDVYVEPAATAPAAPTAAPASAARSADATKAPAADDGAAVLAGSVALFGLRLASLPDGPHGGEGLTFTLDVTQAIYALNLENNLTAKSLDVSLVPTYALQDNAAVRIGRISISTQSF